MRSAVTWPAWEGFWAWQKVADNSTNRPGARVCTLVVFRRGALASAGSSGRENIGSGSLYKERDWFAWVAWPRGLVCSGDRATQGPPQDWEVSLNFLAVPTLLDREHTVTVEGARGRSRAREASRPLYSIGQIADSLDALRAHGRIDKQAADLCSEVFFRMGCPLLRPLPPLPFATGN